MTLRLMRNYRTKER